MTCQRCAEEATVHMMQKVDGRRRELHLCAECARAEGIEVPETPPGLDLDGVIKGLILAHVGELVGQLARRTCPLCGLSFMGFRTAGRLGCPHDYEAFAEGLLPIVARTHGASRHVGKQPKRRARAIANAAARAETAAAATEALRLRAAIRRAIEAEDYERAAELRDALRAQP